MMGFGLNLLSVYAEVELVLFYEQLQRPLNVLPGVELVSDDAGADWVVVVEQYECDG
jgi:hypothetical protein